MKSLKTLTLLPLLFLVSCSALTPNYKVDVRMPEEIIPNTRSGKFLSCVKDLNREGIKQSLIKELCNASYGSIE